MPTIIFTEERILQDEHRGTPQETRYKPGDTLECSDASALHWIARGVAYELVVGSKKEIKEHQETVKKAAAKEAADAFPPAEKVLDHVVDAEAEP